MRTRSGSKAGPTSTTAADAQPEDKFESEEAIASSSDDEAPEELGFSTSRKSAADRRKEEKDARQAASAQKKLQRRGRTSAAAEGAPQDISVSEAAAAGGSGGEHDAEALPSDEDLDFLPEEVLDAVAESSELNSRKAMEQSIVSRHLRAGVVPDLHVQRKRRRATVAVAEGRRVGPVTVKVLGAQDVALASERARSFLQERRYGAGVKRSADMLRPTKIGGVFVHPPRA